MYTLKMIYLINFVAKYKIMYMKKFCTVLVLLMMVFSMFSCSSDDNELDKGGKEAKYRVVFKQSGDYNSYTKVLVIAANGSPLYDDIHNERIAKTTFNEEDMTEEVFSISTEKKAIQFSVVAGVLDLDEEKNGEMVWEVTVYKDDKQIDNRTLTFKDGHKSSGNDLNLYFD